MSGVEPLLRANDLSMSFGTLSVLRHVNLEIHRGEVVGLAGQSGAGKSALAMVLAGFYVPTRGKMHFDGQPLRWPFAEAGKPRR